MVEYVAIMVAAVAIIRVETLRRKLTSPASVAPPVEEPKPEEQKEPGWAERAGPMPSNANWYNPPPKNPGPRYIGGRNQ